MSAIIEQASQNHFSLIDKFIADQAATAEAQAKSDNSETSQSQRGEDASSNDRGQENAAEASSATAASAMAEMQQQQGANESEKKENGTEKRPSRSRSRRTTNELDKELFTFKPKLNRKSSILAQNIIGFYERQNKHCQKQLELVELSF